MKIRGQEQKGKEKVPFVPHFAGSPLPHSCSASPASPRSPTLVRFPPLPSFLLGISVLPFASASLRATFSSSPAHLVARVEADVAFAVRRVARHGAEGRRRWSGRRGTSCGLRAGTMQHGAMRKSSPRVAKKWACTGGRHHGRPHRRACARAACRARGPRRPREEGGAEEGTGRAAERHAQRSLRVPPGKASLPSKGGGRHIACALHVHRMCISPPFPPLSRASGVRHGTERKQGEEHRQMEKRANEACMGGGVWMQKLARKAK